MANSDRQRAAIDFLEELASLGVASNAIELERLYNYADHLGGNNTGNLVDWQTIVKRYNKLNGTNWSANDFKQYIEDLRSSKYGSLGYDNLVKFDRLKNEDTTDGLTFTDIMNESIYYQEDSSGNPVLPDSEYQNDLSNESAREKLLNAYYRDAYDTNAQGTNANQMYNQLVANNQTAAVEAARIADLNAQQAAMQQAATVKQITDQVRNERMARLRAGMSEAQIANQDMQSLMTNINALNQQANEANLARLSAQSAYNTAQADAYNAWLQQANAMATVGSANAAADAGDAINVANRIGYYSEKDKKFKTNYKTGTETGTV